MGEIRVTIDLENNSMKSIPYGKQNITHDDIAAVTQILKSDFLTQGPAVAEFEKAFAEYVGARFAIAVCNATAALHLGALSLGSGPGVKVLTTPITFAVSANSVLILRRKNRFCRYRPADLQH